MKKDFLIFIIAVLLSALFAWIFFVDHQPRPVVRKPVELAIRTWPGQDSQLRPREEWKRWKKPEVHNCVAPKAWVTFTVNGKPVDYGLYVDLVEGR